MPLLRSIGTVEDNEIRYALHVAVTEGGVWVIDTSVALVRILKEHAGGGTISRWTEFDEYSLPADRVRGAWKHKGSLQPAIELAFNDWKAHSP